MRSELVNQGHEAHVIASYYTTVYPDPRVIVHNFPTPPIGYRNIIGQFWILKRAANIVKQNKFDIVHSPEYTSTAVLATLGVKTPLVLTVPGNIFQRIQMGHGYEWWYVYVLKWAARVSAKKCASVIAISKEMKKWWEWTGSDPQNTPMIPLGVNTDRFSPVPDARNLLGLPDNKLIFLYVGRFSQEKGLLDLIEAINLLPTKVDNADFEFVLIGRGPLQKEIENLIHQYNLEKIITLRDWVEQDLLPAWYSAADIFVLPSHSEGFSRTIPEAMICGTPVIGTAITGTEDHVIHEYNGFLFPAHDSKSLAKIINYIRHNKNEIEALGKNAYSYAHQNLTWTRIVDRIIDEVYTPFINS